MSFPIGVTSYNRPQLSNPLWNAFFQLSQKVVQKQSQKKTRFFSIKLGAWNLFATVSHTPNTYKGR